MRFKIKEIGEDGLDLDLPVGAAWLAAHCPDVDIQPGPEGLALHGRLERSGDDFLLRGEVKGTIRGQCARCLDPALVPIDGELFVTFADRADIAEDGGEPDGADVIALEGDEIDIGPPLRDEILLGIPVSPLCRADCAGLCSICGGNRNTDPCDCEERHRLATSKLNALSKIKL